MGVELSELAKRLLDAKTFGTLVTINPDGGPQATVMWLKRDGDEVVFSTLRDRQKGRNLRRDPRASVTVFDPENPYLYATVYGTVSMTEKGGRALIDELSHKYMGRDYPVEPPTSIRVVCRLTPTKVIGR